jgi:prepilin-type N-terminal cleavage/methylation domain-containing protein
VRRDTTTSEVLAARQEVIQMGAGSPNCRGFSLIELLVVMAVLLIVGAIAAPTVATTIDAYRLRGTLTSVSGLAQRCRLLALKKNSTSHMVVKK